MKDTRECAARPTSACGVCRGADGAVCGQGGKALSPPRRGGRGGDRRRRQRQGKWPNAPAWAWVRERGTGFQPVCCGKGRKAFAPPRHRVHRGGSRRRQRQGKRPGFWWHGREPRWHNREPRWHGSPSRVSLPFPRWHGSPSRVSGGDDCSARGGGGAGFVCCGHCGRADAATGGTVVARTAHRAAAHGRVDCAGWAEPNTQHGIRASGGAVEARGGAAGARGGAVGRGCAACGLWGCTCAGGSD